MHNDWNTDLSTDCETHSFGPVLTVSRPSSNITLISHGQLTVQYLIPVRLNQALYQLVVAKQGSLK